MNSDDLFNNGNIVRKNNEFQKQSRWRTNSNDLDKEFEEFWISFKQSMINFYKRNEIIERPITYWSNILNSYKKERLYAKIEECIHKYITLYSLDVLRALNLYDYRILETNVKRWKKLREIYKFNESTLKYENMVYLLVDIMKPCIKKYEQGNLNILYFFQELEFIVIYEEYDKIIKLAYLIELPSILDKLNNYIDLSKYISNNYNINIQKNMSGKKILELLKQHNI